MRFDLETDVSPADQIARDIFRRLENMRPVWEIIGEIAVSQSQDSFDRGQDPDGTPWPESHRAQREGGQTLIKSGRLRSSINYQAGRSQVAYGTNVAYAAPLFLGATIPPRVIKPKTAKALFWPGAAHPVKQVNHPGAEIPPRKFMPDAETLDWAEVRSAIMEHLTGK